MMTIIVSEFRTVFRIVSRRRPIAVRLQRVRHSDVLDLGRTTAEALWTSKEASLGEHTSGVRV